MLSTKTLAKIAVIIGVAGVSSVMIMRSKIEERIRNTDYFREAFKTLRKHNGAIHLLGEPIKDMGFDIGNPNNKCNGQEANFEVSVKGSKERGKIFFSATNHGEEGWLIDSLELELKNEPDRRYLLKKNNTQTET